MATTPITSTTTGGSTSGAATPFTPKSLVTDLLKQDPDITKRLLASYNQAYQQGENSSYNDPGEQFGGYTVKVNPTFNADPMGGGSVDPNSVGGYTMYKEEMMPNGKPLQTTLNYDSQGNYLGMQVRQFTGGDSGIEFSLGPNNEMGKPQGFDYSESWKGAIAPLVGMAAMAFGMPGGPLASSLAGTLGGTAAAQAAANALVAGAFGGAQAGLTGGDPLKAFLLSGGAAGLGTMGSQFAPDVSNYFKDLTGSDMFGNFASGAVKGGLQNLPSGDLSKMLAGALTGGAKTVDWSSMLGDIFGGGGLDALGGDENSGFGNLRFNDETGEWYSTGPGESPRDAFGNIIDQSGGGINLNNLINKGVGNLANKAIGSIFGGAGMAGTTGTGTAAAPEDDSFLTPSFGGGQQIQLASLTPGADFGNLASQPAQTAANPTAPNFYNDAAYFDADKYLEPTQGAKAGGLMYAEGGEVDHNPEFFSEGGASIAHRYVRGDGDGTSDSVPAMLATGEFVIPADVVSGLGNGDNDAGAKVLDEFMRTVRVHKRGAKPHELPEDSKGPLVYLEEAYKKVRT